MRRLRVILAVLFSLTIATVILLPIGLTLDHQLSPCLWTVTGNPENSGYCPFTTFEDCTKYFNNATSKEMEEEGCSLYLTSDGGLFLSRPFYGLFIREITFTGVKYTQPGKQAVFYFNGEYRWKRLWKGVRSLNFYNDGIKILLHLFFLDLSSGSEPSVLFVPSIEAIISVESFIVVFIAIALVVFILTLTAIHLIKRRRERREYRNYNIYNIPMRDF